MHIFLINIYLNKYLHTPLECLIKIKFFYCLFKFVSMQNNSFNFVGENINNILVQIYFLRLQLSMSPIHDSFWFHKKSTDEISVSC